MNGITIRKALALLLALLLAAQGAAMAEETAEAAEKDGWHFDSRGFLAGDDNPGEE